MGLYRGVFGPFSGRFRGVASHFCLFSGRNAAFRGCQELMERGIYGLGGFLSVSKELRVLWSTPYLSRLWLLGPKRLETG